MASLQHDDAVRYLARRWSGRAALLALALAAACGGDRNRAAGRDTTGVAVKADSATMSATDTAAPPVADSARSAAADTSTKPAATTPAAPAAKAPAAPVVAKRPAPTDSSSKHAAAPAPPKPPADTAKAQPSQPPAAPAGKQDTSTATTAAADAPLRDEYHQAPRDTVSQAVYNGWKQFNLNCARCHGEDALGTTIAPHLIVSLKPTGPINTKELFMQVVCAGRPEKGMPAWCALGLEMDKINDIYEYVKGRSDAKISPGRPAVKQQG